jgi:hypothetical protein
MTDQIVTLCGELACAVNDLDRQKSRVVAAVVNSLDKRKDVISKKKTAVLSFGTS